MNAKMLREVMQEKGITVVRMCNELGISRKAFWEKCQGITQFKLSEILKIIDLIGKRNAMAIFFP